MRITPVSWLIVLAGAVAFGAHANDGAVHPHKLTRTRVQLEPDAAIEAPLQQRTDQRLTHAAHVALRTRRAHGV